MPLQSPEWVDGCHGLLSTIITIPISIPTKLSPRSTKRFGKFSRDQQKPSHKSWRRQWKRWKTQSPMASAVLSKCWRFSTLSWRYSDILLAILRCPSDLHCIVFLGVCMAKIPTSANNAGLQYFHFPTGQWNASGIPRGSAGGIPGSSASWAQSEWASGTPGEWGGAWTGDTEAVDWGGSRSWWRGVTVLLLFCIYTYNAHEKASPSRLAEHYPENTTQRPQPPSFLPLRTIQTAFIGMCQLLYTRNADFSK